MQTSGGDRAQNAALPILPYHGLITLLEAAMDLIINRVFSLIIDF